MFDSESQRPLIPDHELLRPIGRGSYGEVWMARNAIGTLRAVKVVWRSRFESDRPFDREFQGIKQFEPVSRSHDGLVDVLQVGRNREAGYFYYVMELADDEATGKPAGPDAESIARYAPAALRRRNRTLDRVECQGVIRTFAGLAGALQQLHQGGLVHRDIKPSNIIFVDGVAKLADIGLVTGFSEARSFVGTEGFVPPEGPGGIQADIYALGKTLYEISTGLDRTAFPSLPELPAEELTGHPLLEINAVIRRACDRDLKKRYTSAGLMQSDLVLLLEGASVQRVQAVERRLRRTLQMATFVSALAVVALAGVVVARKQATEERHRKEAANQLLERAVEAERLAKERLYQAYLAQARAGARSSQPGTRAKTLEAIRAATEVGGATAELRSLAASTLLMSELQEASRWSSPRPQTPYAVNIAFSPDHTFVVRALGSDSCELLDMRTPGRPGEVFRTGLEQLDVVGPVARGGRFVALLGRHKVNSPNVVLRLWDAHQREFVLSRTNSQEYFSKSWLRRFARGGTLFLLPMEKEAGLWLFDLETKEPAPQRMQIPFPPTIGEVSPRGDFYLFYDHSPKRKTGDVLGLLDLSNGRCSLIETPGPVHSMDWSPDGRKIIFNTADEKLWFLDVQKGGGPEVILENVGAETLAVALHPTKPLFATSNRDGLVKLWNYTAKSMLSHHAGHGHPLNFSPDGEFLCLNDSRSGSVLQLKLHAESMVAGLEPPGMLREGDGLSKLLATQDSGPLVASATRNEIILWTMPSGRIQHRIPAKDVSLMSFLKSDRLLVIGNKKLMIWHLGGPGETSVPKLIGSEDLPDDYWDSAGSTPSGRIAIVSSLADSPISLLESGGTRTTLEQSSQANRVFEYQRGAGIIACSDAWVAWWDQATGRRTRLSHHPNIRGAALARDESRLLLTLWDSVLTLDVATGNVVWRNQNLSDRTDRGNADWSPDGSVVAVILDPYGISLLNGTDGSLIQRLEHPDGRSFSNVAFAGDGLQLVANSTRGVLAWDLSALKASLVRLGLGWPH